MRVGGWWHGQAALHFHQKQYGAARQILHTLFARIEVLDEALGVQVRGQAVRPPHIHCGA